MLRFVVYVVVLLPLCLAVVVCFVLPFYSFEVGVFHLFVVIVNETK